MKYFRYILKTKKYYITVLVLSVVCIAIALCFSSAWNNVADARKTYSNCTASVVAYDSIPEEADSYANFESNVKVALQQGDGITLNVLVYQFLEDTEYTSNSIVNEDNVLYGDYSVLQYGEIAIPESVSEKYNLNIGDTLYVDSLECEIKYIYRDIYLIYEVEFYNSQTVVFTGIDTVSLEARENYCVFQPSGVIHNRIESLSDVRAELISMQAVYAAGVIVLTALVGLLILLTRRRNEAIAFKRLKLSGEKNLLSKIAAVELGYAIPPCVLFAAVCLLLGYDWLLVACCAATVIVECILYVIYLRLKAGR